MGKSVNGWMGLREWVDPCLILAGAGGWMSKEYRISNKECRISKGQARNDFSIDKGKG